MQDYNTIIGVIQMRQNECSFSVIQARYHIGSGTAQRILNRYGICPLLPLTASFLQH